MYVCIYIYIYIFPTDTIKRERTKHNNTCRNKNTYNTKNVYYQNQNRIKQTKNDEQPYCRFSAVALTI